MDVMILAGNIIRLKEAGGGTGGDLRSVYILSLVTIPGLTRTLLESPTGWPQIQAISPGGQASLCPAPRLSGCLATPQLTATPRLTSQSGPGPATPRRWAPPRRAPPA